MIRMFLILTCFCMLTSAAFATQERVIELPQDQGMWYVSLFGDPADPQYRKMQQWFKDDKGLARLRSQVHYNEYTTDTARFKRYADSLPTLPCLRIQNSKGTVMSEFWSGYIPKSSSALLSGISQDLQGKTSFRFVIHRRRYHCPGPQPAPAPAPAPPSPTPDKPPVLDTPPVLEEPESEEPGFPWLVALAAAAIGAGIGFASGYKKEHIDQPDVQTKL